MRSPDFWKQEINGSTPGVCGGTEKRITRKDGTRPVLMAVLPGETKEETGVYLSHGYRSGRRWGWDKEISTGERDGGKMAVSLAVVSCDMKSGLASALCAFSGGSSAEEGTPAKFGAYLKVDRNLWMKKGTLTGAERVIELGWVTKDSRGNGYRADRRVRSRDCPQGTILRFESHLCNGKAAHASRPEAGHGCDSPVMAYLLCFSGPHTSD